MRRLSNGSNFLGAFVDEEDSDMDMMSVSEAPLSRRTSTNSRRSSFRSASGDGKSGHQTAMEQARISDMYKVVIKLSAENKINNKNSWSFDFIDQMGKLIREESRQGVNFQKASCTLDASVKIYSHRVDDTHASSHRILESLSRNDNGEEGDADGDGENEAGPVKRTAKVGSKANSTRLNIESMIEKNAENINQATVEKNQSADPTFQKMSKAFDEGGAKGMLMNNLRVVSNSSCVRFQGQTYIEEPAAIAAPAASTTDVNLAELVGKAGIDIGELFSMRVCPALDEYRIAVGIDPSAEDMKLGVCPTPDLSTIRAPTVYYASSVRGSGASSPIPHRESDFDTGHYDDGGMDDGGYFGGDDDDAPVYDNTANNATAPTSSASVMDASGKIRWNSVFDSTSNQGTLHSAASAVETARSATYDEGQDTSLDNAEGPVDGEALDAVPVTSEFGYFDMNQVMSQQNAWAGAKHWKFGRRARTTPVPSETASLINVNDAGDDSDGEEATAGGKAKKPKKKAAVKDNMFFDFESEPLSRDAFLVPKKGKTDTTVLAAAALDKQRQNAMESIYDLPPDAKLQAKDLCRLFLCPSIIVPPTQPGFAQALGDAKPMTHTQDRVWGAMQEAPKQRKQSSRKSILLSKPINPEELFHSIADDNADYGDNYDDDGGDNFVGGSNDDYHQDFNCTILDESQFFGTQGSQQIVLGLEINTGNLLKAARTVDKVDIGYATASTKVNVRKLKSDIWDHIHRTIRSRPAPVDTENAAPASALAATPPPARGAKAGKEKDTKDGISFRGLIGSVSQKQEQSSVTLPFYFICLLHLANEKTLEIKGTENMDDLIIS